mmetsp:Transcript_52628/g.111776  ORF Transcript_52628/g.111776 Transcript_52628/m.111776 type:complete len:360 (+) Transcript_52628:80-1159(+)|eukprot:CAMPEP_0172533414 /NCGR_PEP_ID=MMETSP1067-20121228/6131_1 /TAXON_ID=265564 ORGANISM="Thalassiosira punctigera, Strain Tpunct2005C2" /NCGR_SAMPLE_ID=MMETSP1067 /ASSEMBLY_ACC=CAM_ASM_000444 /LENGTH=359 /DNA_ID=CAMNT_0013318059 /DNA_START=70 /DNA_END=1149 /DNA_ORIENTATION=+
MMLSLIPLPALPFVLPTLLLSLNPLSKAPNYLTGRIASDERVVFFPTIASKINETHWKAPVHGWIFEPELESRKRKVAMKGLEKLFQVTDSEEKRLLARRFMPFTVDNQSMKYVNVKVGKGGLHRLPRSRKDGHFVGRLALRDDELDADDDGIVRYEAIDSERNFAGAIHLVPPTGLSVISDIDDTVKITNYLDKKEFYKNTFLREFREVPGMKELFRSLKSRRDDVSFHYVSASPYQLFEELSNFFDAKGFPPATFHLKRIRVKDKTLLQLFADPMEYKMRQITPILDAFPKRRFILVGDSGEKDPEVYKELYKRYSDRIEKIWIRNVNGANATRMEGVDLDRWSYFDDGFDLMDEVA